MDGFVFKWNLFDMVEAGAGDIIVSGVRVRFINWVGDCWDGVCGGSRVAKGVRLRT